MYVRAHVCVRACASVCARKRVCTRVINNTSRQTQEYDELVRKQRDEGAEKIFRKMRWDCRSCELSDDPIKNQNFTKPLGCFGVRNASDFVQRLLPQGKWTRCKECSDERKGHLGKDSGHLGGNSGNIPKEERAAHGRELGGNSGNIPKEERAAHGAAHGHLGGKHGHLGGKHGHLGGNNNNKTNEERSLASSRACETCARCNRLLTRAYFWPEDWKHRTLNTDSLACKECRPTPRSERMGGFADKNARASQKAADTPITCKVCKRSLPRTQFRPTTSGKYQISKGLTCEECRAAGKMTKPGKKRPQQNQ